MHISVQFFQKILLIEFFISEQNVFKIFRGLALDKPKKISAHLVHYKNVKQP